MLHVPPSVHLRYVDLSIELQVLGFYRSRREELDQGGEAVNGDERAPLLRSVGLSPGSEFD